MCLPARPRFRGCLGLCAFWVALLPAWSAGAQDPSLRPSNVTHVRPTGSPAACTLERGQALSPTLRGLLGQLEESDLVVYIEERPRRAGRPDAWIEFIGAATGTRYARIIINMSLGPAQQLALLGHELQHALEIVARPEIRDRGSFLRYYEQFGTAVHRRSFDSAAALKTGEGIRQELAAAAANVGCNAARRDELCR